MLFVEVPVSPSLSFFLAIQMEVEFIPTCRSDGGSKVLIVGLRDVIKKKFLWIKK